MLFCFHRLLHTFPFLFLSSGKDLRGRSMNIRLGVGICHLTVEQRLSLGCPNSSDSQISNEGGAMIKDGTSFLGARAAELALE